ncbi:MAG: acyltransferase [Bacteroidales bacterium]|nr:acyltransferase [Bacteroidales bacterium]
MTKYLFKILHKYLTPRLSMEDKINQMRQRGVKIGINNYIGNVNFGSGGRDPIKIGNNCVLTGCTILGHDASPAVFIEKLYSERSINDRVSFEKLTEIKDNCFIGWGAIILPGVTVGANSIVGAGAIVTRDVPPNCVVAGNPAKFICTIEEFISKHENQILEHPEWYPKLNY